MVVCGGLGNTQRMYDGVTPRAACHKLDVKANMWFEAGELPHGPVIMSGYAYHPAWGLVITGGMSEEYSSRLDSVLVTRDGSSFEELPPLPVAKAEHCLAIIDEQTLFVTGGLDAEGERAKDAYIYRRVEWSL